MTTTDLHAEKILILDFGSQYTQLIARRVREAQVYCEIRPWFMPMAEIAAFNPKGVILSGGHQSVYDPNAPTLPPGLLELGVPVFGICYGLQLIGQHFGATVAAANRREYGFAEVWPAAGREGGFCAPLFAAGNGQVWMSHGDHLTAPPEGFTVVAASANSPVAALADERRGIYGVQFHPEVSHTRNGAALVREFVRTICGCGGQWTAGNFIEYVVREIRARVGAEQVVLGLSGGVDSAVAAALILRAIGEQLTCVFIDNGLLRLNEGEQVMATFAQHLGARVIRVDAADRFLGALVGVTDPERKRKLIGHAFIELFEAAAARIPNTRWLAQGTIYPDVIESAGANTGVAATIKSHHNVGGLPERMGLKLLEPLRELFKDEVRQVGVELGLPHRMVYRHPFPGPGLGVRILGEVRAEYADLLRRADAIYLEELERAGLYDQISQAFAVFLPVKSVGVMGDGRSYDYVVALRAVTTTDFMTATAFPMPHELLSRVSNRIINEVRGINRVVYDVTSKPPGTIEWE